MSTSPDGIYEPGIIDPGFPVQKPTQPFWLSEPSKIGSIQSPWVEKADIAVIGSGMTAVSLVRTLLSKRPELKIVILEARDLCSGATGRNGGHVKVMSPGVWFDRKEQYGLIEAVRVMEFEHGHLREMAECIEENGINCDLRLLEGLDVYHDLSIFDRAVRALKEMGEHAPALVARYTVYSSRKALQAKKCSEKAVGAIGMPSASMWPYKMVSSLFEKLLAKFDLSIQTNTLVTSIQDDDGGEFATVVTDRGNLRARHVVHATNAWMSHLVPELRPFVSPVRANVQRQLPIPVTIRVDRANSYWLRYAEHDYDYMMQRPDGAFIVGRANTGRRATSDDSSRDLLPQTHLKAVTPRLFDFGSDMVDITHSWSGIVAFTQDGNPLIGKLPFSKKSHQWVCAAYQGIGMVRAFRSAQMLALLLLGEEIPNAYPRSLLITDQRLKDLQEAIEPRRTSASKL